VLCNSEEIAVSCVSAISYDLELHPRSGPSHELLEPLIRELSEIEFTFRQPNLNANQGQIVSDFDSALEQSFRVAGAKASSHMMKGDFGQKLDFLFSYRGKNVAVEIEKTNREKILRDILKCHIYLKHGVDFALIALPRNYVHARGTWDLFDFGKKRYNECLKYDFGSSTSFDKIALLGYSQALSAPCNWKRLQALPIAKQSSG
jgi:hypothetical protein